MSVFYSHARKYYESGYSVIPLDGKKPILNNWSQYCETMPTDEEIDLWCEKYPNANIGLCLGKASNLCAVDFDLDIGNYQQIENFFKGYLPGTLLKKQGKKGWTAFYQYNGMPSKWFDKDKHRLVDFLSSGKQTVIPPSIHPDTGMAYRWTAEDLINIDARDLPTLPSNFFEICTALCGADAEKTMNFKTGRHDVIVGYGYKVIEKFSSVEDFARELIRFDTVENKDFQYFTDRKYFRSKGQFEAALEVAKKIEKTVSRAKKKRGETEEWKTGDVSEEETEYSKYKLFFDTLPFLKTARVELLSKVCQIKTQDGWVPVENSIGTIKSLATDQALNVNRVAHHLDRWISDSPRKLLIDIPEWDNKDRLGEMLKFVKAKNFTSEEFEEIIKEFCAGIFKRLENNEYQNKFVILEGEQGIGKDTFIKNLFSGFENYFSNMSISQDENRNLQNMSQSIVINIAEFDKASKISVAMLKDMITAEKKSFRSPYARRSAVVEFMCSFISSCNLHDVLRDPTGNRRFVFIELESIDFQYPKHNPMQLLAQYRELARQNYKASKKTAEKVKSDIEMRTPDDPLEIALSLYDSKIEVLSAVRPTVINFTYPEVSLAINEVCRETQVGQRTLLSALKRTRRSFRDNLTRKTVYAAAKNLGKGLQIHDHRVVNSIINDV